MMQTTRQYLLAVASKRVGKEALAKRLSTPLHLLEAWMDGVASMPDRKFLELAQVIDDLGDDPSSPR
jgi:hypothetical protein